MAFFSLPGSPNSCCTRLLCQRGQEDSCDDGAGPILSKLFVALCACWTINHGTKGMLPVYITSVSYKFLSPPDTEYLWNEEVQVLPTHSEFPDKDKKP
jgi:hypothetical protein